MKEAPGAGRVPGQLDGIEFGCNGPLILAALPEHHHRFRSVSQNPFLLTEGVKINPDAVTNDALRALAWQVVQPQYQARLAKLKIDFEQTRATGRGSDNMQEIAEGAASGRIATPFIAADRPIAGHLDDGTGRVVGGALDNPRVHDMLDDMLDDLGELVGSGVVRSSSFQRRACPHARTRPQYFDTDPKQQGSTTHANSSQHRQEH